MAKPDKNVTPKDDKKNVTPKVAERRVVCEVLSRLRHDKELYEIGGRVILSMDDFETLSKAGVVKATGEKAAPATENETTEAGTGAEDANADDAAAKAAAAAAATAQTE